MNRKGGGVLPKRKIYMAVTKDALSLPLAVADSPGKLAELRGEKPNTVRRHICNWKKGLIKRPGYIVVEVEEDMPERKKGEFDGGTFRERFRLLREESGMTQEAFAALTGISVITIYGYERKDRVPGADMLFRIAAATGCSVDWLIGLKEEENENFAMQTDND